MASRWQERFAAIAPMSAGGMDTGTARLCARRRLPIWMFWVWKDDANLQGWTVESGTWTVEPGRLLQGTTGDAGSAVLLKKITAPNFELFGEFDWWVVGTDAGDEMLADVRECGIGLSSATASTTGRAAFFSMARLVTGIEDTCFQLIQE